jgi:DNA-binding GntR family transcriptional regulator
VSVSGASEQPSARDVGILADRIAAALVNREPGWRLPRASELARRHNVSDAEVRVAIDRLVARQLVRRSPDGRLYRASPAEYMVSLEGMAGLSGTVDPMGGKLTCLSYSASWRPAPEDAACALQVQPGEQVSVLRLTWALNGASAAVSTVYLVAGPPEPRALASWVTASTERGELPLVPPLPDRSNHRGLASYIQPRAVAVQMDLPSASIARRLRLAPSQLAVLVTGLFDDSSGRGPVALTVTILRPDMFRITVENSLFRADGGNLQAAWSLASGDET